MNQELQLGLPNAAATLGDVTNFGRNVSFRPSAYLTPHTETEVLNILEIHRGKNIRAVGKLHSWSEAPRADGILIDLRYLDHVQVEQDQHGVYASVGAGCQIKRVLTELQRQAFVTLPSVGLITEQTIAGAIATGTHGSGKHSLSHYVTEVRLAIYDPVSGLPTIREVCDGVELLAARCSLGCMGVIVSVKMRCRPSYMVEEHIRGYATLDGVLAAETEYPLQQFFLIPWSWRFIAQHRREVADARSRWAAAYRVYWFLGVDLGLHLWIQLMVKWLRSSRVVKFFYRWILPHIMVYRWRVIGKSQSMLTMEHELFRHIEIEIFVKRTQLHDAIQFVQDLLNHFDNPEAPLSGHLQESLTRIGLIDSLPQYAGTYTHHYPICIRRVLPDNTLISMASGECDPWYAMSFISYAARDKRSGFMAFANFLGESLAGLFGARPHWGKVFPADPAAVLATYPRLEEFRQIRAKFDPTNAFANRWTAFLFAPGGMHPQDQRRRSS